MIIFAANIFRPRISFNQTKLMQTNVSIFSQELRKHKRVAHARKFVDDNVSIEEFKFIDSIHILKCEDEECTCCLFDVYTKIIFTTTENIHRSFLFEQMVLLYVGFSFYRK